MQKNYIEKLKDAGWTTIGWRIIGVSRCHKKFKFSWKKCEKIKRSLEHQITKQTSILPEEAKIIDRIRFLRFKKVNEDILCPVCENIRKYISRGDYSLTCGKKDQSHQKFIEDQRKKAIMKLYGVEYYSQAKEFKHKVANTNLKRYGAKSYTQTEEYKHKAKNTNLERYGVEHYSKTEEYKQRIKITNLIRYKTEHYSKTPEFRHRIKKTSLERFGMENYTQTEECKQKIKQTNLKHYGIEYHQQKHLKNLDKLSKEFIESNFIDGNQHLNLNKFQEFVGCGTTACYKYCHQFNVEYKKYQGSSRAEDQLTEFISLLEHNVKIDRNRRDLIKPKELDIYLPNYNLAIEYNGLLWHSSGQGAHSIQTRSIASDKHLAKTKLSQKNNIDLIHIFEDEYLRDPAAVEKLIARKLGKLPWPDFYPQQVRWPTHHGQPTHLLKIGYRITKIIPPRANYFNIDKPTEVSKWSPCPTQEEALDNGYRIYYDCGEYVLEIS